jgi:peptidylprolyl isomerase
VRRALASLKEANAEAKKKEKAAFGGIFSKVDMYDDKKGLIVPSADNPYVFFELKQGDEDLGRYVSTDAFRACTVFCLAVNAVEI